MLNILKIATRILFRYKRRTLLTSTLVTLGVTAVLLFSNSDILSLDYSVEYTVKSVTEEGDRYFFELKARNATVAYDGLKMEVEKDTLLPMVIECYAASGMLIKTLRYDKIEDFGHGLVRPLVLETDSPLHKGYKSVMVLSRTAAR